jgi:hypothetical protein
MPKEVFDPFTKWDVIQTLAHAILPERFRCSVLSPKWQATRVSIGLLLVNAVNHRHEQLDKHYHPL